MSGNMQTLTDKETDRWNYIDLIEFLGMLFVVIYHSNTYSYSWMEDHSGLSYLRYYFRTILSACVPLFFFANGYLLLNRTFDLRKHIIKTIRIIILTFLWGIIDLLILMPIKNEYLSLGEFATYLWTWRMGWINHLWYMGALICIYLFFPLIKSAFDNNRKSFLYFTVGCAILSFGNTFINCFGSIILNVMGFHVGELDYNWFNIFNPLDNMLTDVNGYPFVYFCVGGLAHGLKDRIISINAAKKNIVAASVMIISCFGLFVTGIAMSDISGQEWDVVWNGYDTIFTFINVCMIFALSLSYKGSYRIIRLISSNTLGIYFMHPIFIHWSGDFVCTIPIAETFVGCIMYSLVIILFCLLLTQILHKIPVIQKLLKI